MLTINNTLDGYLKDVEIKGNTIQNASNLADIKSVGEKVEGQELYEIPVLSCGKNLANVTLWYDNKSISPTGVVIDEVGSNSTVSEFISIAYLKESIDYVVPKPRNNTGGITIAFYDMNKAFLSRVFTNIFTVPSEAKYIRVKTGIDNKKTFQLEEGTVATPYEPYQEDKLTILSPTPLEKVGDVADRLICKDGVWGVEKNIGTVVLNGSENWRTDPTTDNMINMWFSCENIKANTIMLCDKFNYEFSFNYSKDKECIGNNNNNVINLSLAKSRLVTQDAQGFKQWLQDNNVLVKYATTNPIFIPLPHSQQVKLRTFANKTNISFLTEIEGTIKAQVPKSLGATVNTHTTQISNLNKELDRVKKLEESTVSTVETESDFTTVEATSNGYFEDVKLEGKTIKNLLGSDGRNSVSLNQSLKSKLYTLLEPIPANTDIFIRVSVTAKKAPLNGLKLNVMNEDGSYSYFTGFNGVYDQCLKITHDKNITKLGFYMPQGEFDNDSTANITYEKAQVTLVDVGTSYFEGLASVGDETDEIVVSSVNENLFDVKDFYRDGWQCNEPIVNSDDSFTLTPSTVGGVAYVVSKPFELEVGETYKLDVEVLNSTTPSDNSYYVWVHNTTNVAYADLTQPFTATEYGKIVDLAFYVYNATTLNSSTTYKVNLYKYKNEDKPYTPHQSDKKRLLFYNEETQTWEKPILREWDSIEKHSDGKYYYHQRSGEVVLNGSENWGITSTDTNTIRFYTNLNNASTTNNVIIPAIMDKFTETTAISQDVEGFNLFGITNNTRIRISKTKLSTQDVSGFKQWLQANNVTVVYQLAEEKVYECTNIDLITYANETNYIVESGVIVPRTTLKVHNNISNVVSLLQKKVSLLESNITKYMITQNRMQLASTYSADSVTFKVDYALCSEEVEYNEDLYNLILNNILVGKDNYNYDKMFTMILDYASWNQISWEQFDILVGLMDIQHNPPIEETPTDDEIVEDIIEEETPVE